MQTKPRYLSYTHLRAQTPLPVDETLVQVRLKLTPLVSLTSEGAIMVRAYTLENRAVDVILAERQAETVKPQIFRLRARLTKTCMTQGPRADIDTLRQHALLEGVWRRRFRRDADGWQTHTHQFHVSKLSLLDARATGRGE